MSDVSGGRAAGNGSDGQPLVLEERIEVEGCGAYLFTFNRPAERNPISPPVMAHLRERLVYLSEHEDPAAYVFTGAGEAFSAGGDLKGYQKLFRRPGDFQAFIDDFQAVCDYLEQCRAVTVAMVNGTCVAGGLEVALACDIITIAESALIGDGHLRFSQLPGAGGSQRLVRAISYQRAKYWLLSGKLFSAEQAVACGLAVEAIPDGALRTRTWEILGGIVGHSRLAIQEMKRLIRAAADTTLAEGLHVEGEAAYRYATTSQDAREGLLAFAERRPPRYEGK